jgi:hypothetical protein
MFTMSKRTAIAAIWRLTLISFAFVQFAGVVVVVSVISSKEAVSAPQVIGAYVLFLIFSGLVFLAARRVRRTVRGMYEE